MLVPSEAQAATPRPMTKQKSLFLEVVPKPTPTPPQAKRPPTSYGALSLPPATACSSSMLSSPPDLLIRSWTYATRSSEVKSNPASFATGITISSSACFLNVLNASVPASGDGLHESQQISCRAQRLFLHILRRVKLFIEFLN